MAPATSRRRPAGTRLAAPPASRAARRTGRRRILAGAVGGAALLAASACGDERGSAAGSAPSGTPRVVAIGQGADADALVALGITPVGISTGYHTDVYPWTARALGGRPVELVSTTDGVPIERIAAMRPTLIAATTYFQLEPVRARLESIAPVIGPGSRVDKETWQQTTTRIGDAVGRGDQARRIVGDTERIVAATRTAHPGWQGRTFTFGPVIPGQDLYTVNSTTDASAALLTALGLRLTPAVQNLPTSGIPGRARVSSESVGVFDADVLLLAHFGDEAARAEFERRPLFRRIPAVRRGSYVPLDLDTAIALAFPSVLTIPYVLERIAPALDAALR